MVYQYNPLENGFTTFESVENPTVEIQLPTMPEPLNLSDNFQKIGEDGIPLAQNKININFNSKHEDPIQTQNYEEQSSSKVNSNISGRKKQAMEFFQSKGLAPHQAAGIVGNLMLESGSPNLSKTDAIGDRDKGPKGSSYGIGQWRLDRRTDLKNFAAKRGKPMSDFYTQLEFIWEEMNGSQKQYKILEGLLNSKNAKEATISFMNTFERPNSNPKINGIATRIKYSESLLSND